MSDVLRTPTLSSYAYLGCRDRGIAVGYHSLGVYHGMLEYVIMIIRTKIAATVHASPSGAGVLEGAAADMPSGVVAGVVPSTSQSLTARPLGARQKIDVRVGQKLRVDPAEPS
jgi:hypothetical protein